MEIGPHMFLDTFIYEANYIASRPSVTLSLARAATPASTPNGTPVPFINITPSIMTQINAVAEADASVTQLLQRVHAGRATPTELRTLGALVQSIVNAPAPVGNTDFIFEFAERPGDRWILPGTHAVFEWRSKDQLAIRTALSRGEGQLDPIMIMLKNFNVHVGSFVERWADPVDAGARAQALQDLVSIHVAAAL
jgi:hypothetical protein